MQRMITMSIVLIVFLGIDLYVFQGFRLLTKKWFPNTQLILNVVYWAIPILLLGVVVGTAFLSPDPRKSKVLMWAGSILFGITIAKITWLAFMVIDDLFRIVRYSGEKISSSPSGKTISRSEFIVSAGAIVAGSLFSGLIYGIAKGAHNYKVNCRTLKLKNLPDAFKGFRIAQISDVHSGSFWNKEAVNRGIDLILEQKPDAIFFTGDLVNNTADEFEGFKEMFGKLQAKHGVYSVLGNHDYGDYVTWPDKNGLTKAQNLENLKNHQKDMGWNLLMNEHKIIEKDGAQLGILGVENWSAHSRFPKYGSLEAAYNGVEQVENKLLLSHDPSHWKDEVLDDYPDIDAVFSGHTHGMQFGIDTSFYKWSPVKYQYPEWADLYEENGRYLYVNRGFGYIGYPGRLGFLPEITVFELDQA
ncbi:MAG: metallophosphoesterase [Bacteroidia bacterium]|nr:metallophosphoesterase [Bacteroidia bacterium]